VVGLGPADFSVASPEVRGDVHREGEAAALFQRGFTSWPSPGPRRILRGSNREQIMKIAFIIVRTLLGLMFFVFGLMFFFMTMPPPPAGPAADFMKVMFSTHYIHVVKCFEVAGGLILLTGRFTPLGLTLVGPVIVNILIYDVCVDRSGLPMGIVIAALALFLLWYKRKSFAGLVSD
jgi:uncharacterized membrane protein YphA (DoxX/SURF4 family)